MCSMRACDMNMLNWKSSGSASSIISQEQRQASIVARRSGQRLNAYETVYTMHGGRQQVAPIRKEAQENNGRTKKKSRQIKPRKCEETTGASSK